MQTLGIGTRVLNFLVDTIIIAIIAIFGFNGFNVYAKVYGYPSLNFWLCFACTLFIYYTLFETIFARTPGKWITYSKVINKQGLKPSFVSIIIRSMVRLILIDMFFIPFLDKPLHDFISKTELIES